MSVTRRSPVAIAGLVAGLLAIAGPANAGAALGHPADGQAIAIARDARTGQDGGVATPRVPTPAQLQDLDTEI